MVFQDSSLLWFYLLLQKQTSPQCDPAVKEKMGEEGISSLMALEGIAEVTAPSNSCSFRKGESKAALTESNKSTPELTKSCLEGTSEGHPLPVRGAKDSSVNLRGQGPQRPPSPSGCSQQCIPVLRTHCSLPVSGDFEDLQIGHRKSCCSLSAFLWHGTSPMKSPLFHTAQVTSSSAIYIVSNS